MTNETSGGRGRKGRSHRFLAIVGTLAVAAVTALIVNLVNKGADRIVPPSTAAPAAKAAVHGSPLTTPVSYSSSPFNTECNGGTFLPEPIAHKILGTRNFGNWSTLEREPGAAPATRAGVEASIQGESSRVITLTGISFKVQRMRRPQGVIVSGGCAGPIPGRAIEVDLDTPRPRIVASNSEPHGLVGETHPLSRPIVFPWTVSLTEPLQLYIFARSAVRYCRWRAEIRWASGALRGVISIPSHGYYSVAGGAGLQWYIWEGQENGWVHSVG